MTKFNMCNVARLLFKLFCKDESGNYYPRYKDAFSIQNVLDDEDKVFFDRIYRSIPTLQSSTKKET